MEKETHWLIHGLNHSHQLKNTTLPIITNISLSWTLFTKTELLRNKKMPLKKSLKELLPITRTLITLSMVNLPSIYNRPEPVETILQLLLTPRLSTGEEMIPFKREILQLEEMTVGHQQTTLTGISLELTTWLVTKMQPLSDRILCLMLDQIYTWKTNRLIMEEMHGDKLKEMMQ